MIEPNINPVPQGSIVEVLVGRSIGQVQARVLSGGVSLYQIKLENEQIEWMEEKEFKVVVAPRSNSRVPILPSLRHSKI